MQNIKKITEKLIEFRNAREWQQFHKPKDLALSLVLESAEFLELFQWKDDGEVAQAIIEQKELFQDELADVFNWVLILAHDLDINILAAAEEKIKKNGEKYPVEKARGKSTKYTKL